MLKQKHNPEFIWCDLSTFNLDSAINFYKEVFSWEPYSSIHPISDYTQLLANNQAASAVFTMPEFLQKINMPSFWMSYVSVANIEESYELAQSLGAKGEIEPSEFSQNTKFALVRDPSGAGFTLYEGEDLGGRVKTAQPGRMIWNELHVPSLDLIEPFYSKMFGWQFIQDPSTPNRHLIYLSNNTLISTVLELTEREKGSKNYWIIYFYVENLQATLQTILKHNGSVLVENKDSALVNDNQGACFYITEQADFAK